MSARSYFEKLGENVEFNKGDIIFSQGSDCESLYYVKSGLLKAYYTTSDGKEFIKSFIVEENIIGSLSTLMTNSGSSFSLICLEPTKVIRLPFVDCLAMAESNLEVANLFIKLLTNLAIKKEKREYEFLCLSAEERFELLVKEEPELLERVTQNDISRFLGITPVGLSRIRSRLQS